MMDMEKEMKQVVLQERYLKEPVSAQAYLKEAFDFPPYYGMNLDALHDCLTELSGTAIILQCEDPEEGPDGYAARVLRVMEDSVEENDNLTLTLEKRCPREIVPGAYQLIALDMDGTVLNTEKKVSERTQKAIHRALAAGKEVVFCTGRCYAEMRKTLADYPDMHYLIGESGALVYDIQNQRVISRTVIDEEIIDRIRKVIDGRDIMPVVFSEGELYANRDQVYRLVHYQMAPYAESIPKLAMIVDDVFETISGQGSGYEKLNLFHAEVPERTRTRAILEEIGIPAKAELVDSEISSLECSCLHTHKGNGIRELAQLLNIPVEQTIMVGDAGNDVPGLRAAGLSVAMGNGLDFVKDLCDVVVADNDHDGCAEAIEKYLLGE